MSNAPQNRLIVPHAQSSEAIRLALSSDFASGLPANEAAARLELYGRNVISEKKAKRPFVILLSQFKGPFVILLFVAVGLSTWFREWLDAIAILVVIIVNGIIGFLMEYKAERSMEALKRLTKMNTKVLRDGRLEEISSDKIVPGDILIAEAGDMITADARIISSSQLQVDESALTGESVAVEKADAVLDENISLGDRLNMLFKGTYITRGNVRAIVTGTGMSTELGRIAVLVQSADQAATPLEKKIAQFSKKILWLTVALIVLIFLAGVLDGDNVFSMLQTSIALAVAAIPEGLPIVTTLALAQGMMQMARQNVIIKKLSAVETLGGTNIICTDKTGTLTQNRIEVNTVEIPGAHAELKQDHLHRKTEFISGDRGITSVLNYQLIQRVAVLCSTADISFENSTLQEIGDPLETGLLKYVYSEGIDVRRMRDAYPKLSEEPFASDTKIMATLHRPAAGPDFIAAKGAAEALIAHCSHILEQNELKELNADERAKWIAQSEKLAHSGLRVIAAAYRETKEIPERLTEDLVFAGLIGLLDPPREEVYEAILQCKTAGIEVIMITGDHPETARNIAAKLGLIEPGSDNVIHGKDMPDYEQLTEADKKRWLRARIFARVTPKQKLDLVTLFQEHHFIVGMTGDGVNDAPALQKADIGIAMGQRGTQVAQEVSDMILKDDSFSSIVVAIKRGRIIFENIRKFIIYLLSCNLSELFIISFSSVMNLHYALVPLQILFINLVTDVLPALALGVTQGSNRIMKIPPRDPAEPIIDRKRWLAIFVYAVVIAGCALCAVAYTHYRLHKDETWNPALCNNILFITLILCQLWHAFNMTLDNNVSFFRTDVFRNRYIWYAISTCLLLTLSAYFVQPVAKVLSLFPASVRDLGVMFGFSLLSMVIIRTLKHLKFIL